MTSIYYFNATVYYFSRPFVSALKKIMKHCPKCQTRYTDDTLQFCLQDGAALASDFAALGTAELNFGETETVVGAKPPGQMRVGVPAKGEQTWKYDASQNVPPPAAKKSNTLLTVLLTIVTTIFLSGAFGIGAWLYFRNGRGEIAANTSGAPNRSNQGAETNVNKKKSPTPAVTPSQPANTVNANVAPNAAETVAPPRPIDREQIRTDVSQQIFGWKSLAESRDLDNYMDIYADTVDYYNKKKASFDFVRRDKMKAFGGFQRIKIDISDLNVTPDASGEKATAVFDKEWVFDGERYSAGKVRSQLQLQKFGDRWLITGERDLKIYYTE